MRPTKDNFSDQAAAYRQFRPTYPRAIYDRILSEVPDRAAAWDCGTGNGQVAVELARYFQKVEASDISEQQLALAPVHERIRYTVCRAEATPYPDDSFDLVTVAQAAHWFDLPVFYREVRRVGRPGGLLAVWGYGLMRTRGKPDELIRHFYTQVVGPYWDPERHYLDEGYATLPFDLDPIGYMEQFELAVDFSLPELVGYLNTWSSVRHYIRANNHNPVDELAPELAAHWPRAERQRWVFPLFLRLGRI